MHNETQIQYSKNIKEQNCVDWTERLKKHLPNALKDRYTKKHCIETKHLENDRKEKNDILFKIQSQQSQLNVVWIHLPDGKYWILLKLRNHLSNCWDG